tara:strand:+ start:192 stop:1688 length:1497 start_codon:yes stop_codon:yes gene_type:complete
MKWVKIAEKKLKKYWGYDKLKSKQIKIINELINGEDVVGLLPTGYGKSLCYLIPPLITKKCIIIVSPLISLMEDQKLKLEEMNIPVSALHSNNPNKTKEVFDIIDGKIKIVYCSPEFLILGEGLELIDMLVEEDKIAFLAVDESHCISVWGHDFRPNYLKIGRIRDKYPDIPILAVTATATKQVCSEIIQYLKMDNPKVITCNFDRPNLYLECTSCKSIEKFDVSSIQHKLKKYNNDRIIIYVNKRDNAVKISEQIEKVTKRKTCYYHGGIPKKRRSDIQKDFIEGHSKIIVTTVAFGMGIDQNVKCVIIIGAPNSIEDYYQQIGRAGRDGKPADTQLMFISKQIKVAKSFLEKLNDPNPEIKKSKQKNLMKMQSFYYNTGCRRKYILDYFGQIPKFYTCNNCDNCRLENKVDITEIMFKYCQKYFARPVYDKEYYKFMKGHDEVSILDLQNSNLLFYYKSSVRFLIGLINWWKSIKHYKMTLENLPENMKLLINKKD